MSFGEGTNFVSKRRKSEIDTIRILQIKVDNSSVSEKTRMELDSHSDTIVLGKECMEIYNCTIPVKVSQLNTKYIENL